MTPPGLHRIPLVLSGAWTSADRTLWIAKASCDEALVCVSFQVTGGIALWSKSSRLGSDSEAVRIGLGLDRRKSRSKPAASRCYVD
jgi:hypothetical protein